MVKYKNKLHPWKYICVLPVARNPIKISSPNLSQLKPVHEGIRRVLLAQQRGTGGRARPTGPSQSEREAGHGQAPGGERYSTSERSTQGSSAQHYDSPSRQGNGDPYGRPQQNTHQPQKQTAYGY